MYMLNLFDIQYFRKNQTPLKTKGSPYISFDWNILHISSQIQWENHPHIAQSKYKSTALCETFFLVLKATKPTMPTSETRMSNC